MKNRHIKTIAIALAGSLSFAGAAFAEWPERPIHLIVPFPAGSSTDTVARIVGPALGTALGQSVVVENRGGASGAIGAMAVVESDPDGYTIGLGTSTTLAVASALNPNLPYDPLADFAPIGLISASPYVLAVANNVDADSVEALVALAKAAPGKLRYASAGPASLARLTGALFASDAGVELTHIPYKTSAQSVIDLVGGRVDIQFGTIAPVMPHLQAGSIKVLAVTSPERIDVLPDVPTLAELGFEDFDVSLWMALVAPAGTPDDIMAKLNAALNAAVSDPTVAATLEAQGQSADGGTQEALTERITAETGVWKKVSQDAGIVIQ